MKIALLVIDMQKIFLEEQIKELKVDRACEYINYVGNLLRSNNHLVVHVKDVESANGENDDVLDFISEVYVDPSDKIVQKEHSNSFWKTNLEDLLHEHKVGLVIIAGFAAEHCVLFTYNGANERGFKTVLLQNGIVGERTSSVELMYHDRNVISHPVISYLANQ
ncbi:cysteine hydrolase family protein [Bacillus suaedaesalsae]|uniref:Isochorismatase family protein n=1 Tax=Bacillus suaedaesalsae TaxID=2810349 RepID=A0ABS2DHK4_9BACI|nr:isochorismatase family protein [Bacillus suaedaesalsae]MBM6617962.1 isochorismatase family protein [Bacillus suaedaesalsae]